MERNRVSLNKSGQFSSDIANNVSGQESKQSAFKTSGNPAGSASSAAPSSHPAQVSTKAKSIPNDKRPPGRVNNTNYKNAERSCAVAKPEIGSVCRPGSKKGNAVCDFVQFAYEKRRGGGYESHSGARTSGGGSRYSSHRAENYSRFQNYASRNRYPSANYGSSYNKEQYLQATCQFVVMDGFNYAAHLSDADLIVDWEHIEELRLLVDEIPSCPICLYPPTAAKMTRCGHIFCWPCILHYLALSDKSWRKCPICYESVYKNQLKSTVALKIGRLSHGGEVTMRLMRRDKGSNLVTPADETSSPRIKAITDKDVQYSKLLSITRSQVIENILERERVELSLKLADEEEEPEACFIREALESIQERETHLKVAVAKHEKSPSHGSPPTFSPFTRHAEDVVTFVDAFNDEKRSGGSSVRSAQSAPAAVTASARASSTSHAGYHDDYLQEHETDHGVETLGAAATAAATMNDKSYYFYQADDGQQVYLHPVNARCLVHQYGSLAAAPQIIKGEITELEPFVMTEDTRRRFRYLAHLPLTSAFALVELKFPKELLSDETLKAFAGDFLKREQARERKAKEEKRHQTHAERWERAILLDPRNISKYTSANSEPPDIPFSTYVPSAQKDIEAGLSSNTDAGPVEVAAASSLSASPNPSSGDLVQASTPSFAQMLRQGKPKQTPPTKNVAAVQPEQRPIDSDLDEEQREFVHTHSYQDAFGDALQTALDSYRNKNTGSTELADEGSASIASKRKKKKSKGRLLFATGAAAPSMH